MYPVFDLLIKSIAFTGHIVYDIVCTKWGYGAVGSASEWHSEGQGFESPYLHIEKPLNKDGLC